MSKRLYIVRDFDDRLVAIFMNKDLMLEFYDNSVHYWDEVVI